LTPLQAAILGLVEGITEYLPISSTGHLIIAAWLLGLDRTPELKKAVDAFSIIVQGGAILAVAWLYWPRVRAMLRGLIGRDREGRRLFVNLLVAFLPAVVLGLLLDDLIEAHLFRPVPVIAALLLGGVLLIAIRGWQRGRIGEQSREDASGAEDVAVNGQAARVVTIATLTPLQALLIGLCQCVAMWPGTSRSMTSIVGGMVVGLRPREAAEFSFLLGLPTLGGACAYKLAKSFRAQGLGFIDDLGGWTPVIVGIAVATLSAAIAVKWLVGYLSRHDMSLFGWYRIALALALAWLVWGQGLTLAA
jgi:undecaprenyl-diphosphatase